MGQGTLGSPFTIAELASSLILDGHHVYILDGTKTVDVDLVNIGAVTIAPHTPGLVKIDGSLWSSRPNVTIRDIEIYDADYLDRINDIPVNDAYRAESTNNKLINAVLHDTRQGMLIDYKTSGGFEANSVVIYFNGWDAVDRGHGHGLYAANASDDTMIIRNCIIWGNFGYGLHLWAESVDTELYPYALRNILVENCIIFGNNLGGNNSQAIIGGSGAGTTVAGLTLRNCVFYTTEANYNLNLGSLTAGSIGAIVEDNYFVGGIMRFLTYGGTETVRGNKFYCTTELFDGDDYPNNAYGSAPETGSDIILNAGEYGRNTLAIFNWAAADSIVVDVSAVLANGASYRIRNVQDYYIDIVTGTVSETGTITVDMRAVSHTVATPQGWTAPATTFPTFGAFVIEAA